MEIYAAGAAAAFTVDILVYPLDTIKTRYQSQDFLKTYQAGTKNAALAPRGLYQGVGSVILATLPAAGIFFSTYESTKGILSRTMPVPEPVVHSMASSVAEMASCLVLAPAEVIKQNAQMIRAEASPDGSKSSASLQAWRHLTSHGVTKRLFAGYTALVARNLPFTAMQFPLFEYIRSRWWTARLGGSADNKDNRSILATGFVAGGSAASAGAVAAFLTTPSDVVKTRMMLTASQKDTRQGSWQVAREVFHDRGVRGLFRGGLFRSAWTAIGSGLYLGTYDAAKLWLTRKKPDLEATAGL